MDENIWDLLNFLFSEFIVSLVIGYTRNKDDRVDSDKFNLDSFDFNKNYQNYTGMMKEGNVGKKEGDNIFNQDLNDPLLDKVDKI